jgi:acyl-CoA synthetase (AMP-forming)/AMP-acid ligase II
LLLHSPGLDYVAALFGCLYARAIAVPAYPPRSPRLLPRIQAIITDPQAKVILTSTESIAGIQRNPLLQPVLTQSEWVTTDTLDSRLADLWQAPAIQTEDLAFLQYTSGSTGTPKGVMVAHSNLLHNLSMISKHCGQTPESNSFSWLPPYHDLGLICGILYPFYEGFPAALMSPVTFLQRPFLWLQAVSARKSTLSMAPHFAYEMCCRKITPAQRDTLDLSHWEVAANGGEPIRAETLRRFEEFFKPCGFRPTVHFPGYGMAETTLILATDYSRRPFVSAFFHDSEIQQGQAVEASPHEQDAKEFVSYPRITSDHSILIVDPETRLTCPPGKIGEIWVTGPSVAQGYWHNAVETEKTFHAYTADTGQGPFLRTGDLGFMKDGTLFVAGRIKDLLIIRGSNHYPQDIEVTVDSSHFAIRPGCCVAFSVDTDEGEQLVVLAEIDPHYQAKTTGTEETGRYKLLDPQEVVKAVRAAVSEEHDLQIYRLGLLKAGGVLKTSSGKLQRRATRAEFLAERLEIWHEE